MPTTYLSSAFCTIVGADLEGDGLKSVARRPELLRPGVALRFPGVPVLLTADGAREGRTDGGAVTGIFTTRAVVLPRFKEGLVIYTLGASRAGMLLEVSGRFSEWVSGKDIYLFNLGASTCRMETLLGAARGSLRGRDSCLLLAPRLRKSTSSSATRLEEPATPCIVSPFLFTALTLDTLTVSTGRLALRCSREGEVSRTERGSLRSRTSLGLPYT